MRFSADAAYWRRLSTADLLEVVADELSHLIQIAPQSEADRKHSLILLGVLSERVVDEKISCEGLT